jgi:hypothetical protein
MGGRTYRLKMAGEFTDLVRRELGATTLWHENGNTVVEVLVRDQSELHGLLERVSGIGLTLVSLETIAEFGVDAPAKRGVRRSTV